MKYFRLECDLSESSLVMRNPEWNQFIWSWTDGQTDDEFSIHEDGQTNFNMKFLERKISTSMMI